MSYPIILGRTTLDKVYSENPDVETGGSWKSTECVSTWKIALIVVLRDREEQLKIFLRNIIPFLKKQKADFSLFVVEQVSRYLKHMSKRIVLSLSDTITLLHAGTI